MTTMRKYLDWRGWWRGLYVNCIKSATGVVLAVVGTNTVEVASPESMKAFTEGAGLNFKQAIGAFVAVLFIEALRYVNAKPLPDVKDDVMDEVGSG